MNLQKHKALFLLAVGSLVLLVATPALQKVLVYPQTEFFTELWLLGPHHTADSFPYNITSNHSYTVFLGAANNLGSVAYYVVEVKFRNQTQSAPDSFNRTHSSLDSLYSVNFFIPDKGTWEMPLTFSFNYSFEEVTRTVYRNISSSDPDGDVTYRLVEENMTLERVSFNYLRLNDAIVGLQGYSSDFDPQKREFFGNLVCELWIYDEQTNSYVYHNRYVDLKFNMTKA